jgi:hypothetical protein
MACYAQMVAGIWLQNKYQSVCLCCIGIIGNTNRIADCKFPGNQSSDSKSGEKPGCRVTLFDNLKLKIDNYNFYDA